jgi:hypothetical protein
MPILALRQPAERLRYRAGDLRQRTPRGRYADSRITLLQIDDVQRCCDAEVVEDRKADVDDAAQRIAWALVVTALVDGIETRLQLPAVRSRIYARSEQLIEIQGIPVCTENLIRVDDVTESPKLAE